MDDAKKRLERVADVPFAAPCESAIATGGLGVFATIAIPAGSTLILERPFALTAAWDRRRHVCAWCMKEDDIAPLPHCCTCCHCVAYCSDTCAAHGADSHTPLECEALAAFAADEDDDEGVADLVVQAIRILALRHAGRRVRPFPESPVEVGYDGYEARLQGFNRSTRQAKAIRSAVKLALRAMPSDGCVSPNELLDVLNRHQCNALGVLGAGARAVGLASCIGGIHLFNHSCIPNAAFDSVPVGVAEDAGGGMAFALRALADIPIGGEIFHCYAGSADGPSRRLQYLRDHYGFECNCPRCGCVDDPMAEAELADEVDAMRCRCDECGSGLGYPIDEDGYMRRCVHCGGEWEED